MSTIDPGPDTRAALTPAFWPDRTWLMPAITSGLNPNRTFDISLFRADVAQNETLDLAARRLRQRCDEVDLARIGMRRKALTHHLLDFRLQVFRALHAGPQHDDR